MKNVLAVLKNLFGYDPNLKIDDFFAVGIPETKMLFLSTIITLVKAKEQSESRKGSFLKNNKTVTFRKEDSIAETKAVRTLSVPATEEQPGRKSIH